MLISIIIPTYNCSRFIAESIRSVQAQSTLHLEIIVVDDGSTDGTHHLLKRIHDPRVRVIRTTNRGIGAARNEGLRAARGVFIAFNDADDRWSPNKLQQQLDVLNAEPEVGVVFTDFVRFTEDGYLPQTQFSFFPELNDIPSMKTKCATGVRLKSPESFTSLIAFSQFPTWTQTMLFRAECIRDLYFPEDRRVTDDLYFCFRAYASTTAAYIAEPLVEVRRHDSNSTLDLFRLERDVLSTLHDLEEAPLSYMQQAALRQRLAVAEINMAKTYASQRKPIKAIKHLRNSFNYPGILTRISKFVGRKFTLYP